MRVKIEYSYDANDPETPCVARTEMDDHFFTAISPTFSEARTRLLKKLTAYKAFMPVPEPEEVNI